MNVGDKVNINDGSWGFGVRDGQYCHSTSCGNNRKNLTVVAVGLYAMKDNTDNRHGEFSAVNDIAVTDGHGSVWFTQSRFCELVDREIEVRYFRNGEDVTGFIADEAKRKPRGSQEESERLTWNVK
jgi:hypothetical protein